MSLLSHDPPSREYILGRLDRGHIRELADQASSSLFELGHAIELCYMPGDATWYSLTIAPVWHTVGAPGGGHHDMSNVDQSYIGVHDSRNVFLIAYAQIDQVVFCSDEEDWEWIAAKFDKSTPASQLAIAELLKAVFDR